MMIAASVVLKMDITAPLTLFDKLHTSAPMMLMDVTAMIDAAVMDARHHVRAASAYRSAGGMI